MMPGFCRFCHPVVTNFHHKNEKNYIFRLLLKSNFQNTVNRKLLGFEKPVFHIGLLAGFGGGAVWRQQ